MSVALPLPVGDREISFSVRAQAERLAAELETLHDQADDIEQHILGCVWAKWKGFNPTKSSPAQYARYLSYAAVRAIKRRYYHPHRIGPFNLKLPEGKDPECKSQNCHSATSTGEAPATSATGHGDGQSQSAGTTSH